MGTCKSVKYWDCQTGRQAGLPTCDHEEVCSKVKGKTQCRLLPRADKCLDTSGKVCTKKTGEVCPGKTPNTKTTTKKPVTTTTKTPKKPATTTTKTPKKPASPLDFDDEVGCTTGEEIVCEATKQKTSSLPKCSEKGTVCKNVGGKPKRHEVTPEKCRSDTGKLCTTLKWEVCGPGPGEESALIIAEVIIAEEIIAGEGK